MYSSTLPSTSALDGGWVVNATPRSLYPQERPGTHCIGGWVGPRTGLFGCGKSRPHRGSIPGPSSLQRVATGLVHFYQFIRPRSIGHILCRLGLKRLERVTSLKAM